jgi:plasmid replication initiation protein
MRGEHGEFLAVMANPLLRRKLSMDVIEQRIFNMAVGQIDDPWNEKAKLPVFQIRADAYGALTGRSGGSLYAELKKAVKALQHVEVALPGGERIAILAPYAEYVEGEGTIAVEFNEHLKPYLLGLRRYFAKIPVADACKLRSGYAISFYLYCWSWYSSKERGWYMSVEKLRDWLSIKKGVLERISDLNMRVIEQARRELNAKASLTFIAKANRQRRETVGWFFEVKDNTPERRKSAGSIGLPEGAKQAEDAQLESRLESAKARWECANEEQRVGWLCQLDSVARSMAPVYGAEPRRGFLSCLVSVFEPELPGF